MRYEEQQRHLQEQKIREEQDAVKRPERAKRLIKFLEKTKAFEFCRRLNSKDLKIDFDQFKSFLVRLNGIAREIPIKKRKIDGSSVEISGLWGDTVLPPRAEDKEDILKYAFKSASRLGLEDNSYMLPAVINEVHLFNDGNGRTSRTIHLLLSSANQENFNKDLSTALSHEGRFDAADVNPRRIDFEIEKSVLAEHGWHIDRQSGDIVGHDVLKSGVASAFYPAVDPQTAFGKNIKKFEKIADSDMYYVLTAVAESLSSEKYQSILFSDENNPQVSRDRIDPAKLALLSEEEWNKIFESYYKLKKEHAMRFVKIFIEPEKYRDIVSKKSLKDLFIEKIKAEYIENNRAAA